MDFKCQNCFFFGVSSRSRTNRLIDDKMADFQFNLWFHFEATGNNHHLDVIYTGFRGGWRRPSGSRLFPPFLAFSLVLLYYDNIFPNKKKLLTFRFFPTFSRIPDPPQNSRLFPDFPTWWGPCSSSFTSYPTPFFFCI